jgi:hypothetical protein
VAGSERARSNGARGWEGSPDDTVGHANATALLQGLGALGWQEGSNLRIALRWFGCIDPVLFERYVAEVFALGPEVLVTGIAQWRRCGGEQARSRLCSRTSLTRSAKASSRAWRTLAAERFSLASMT